MWTRGSDCAALAACVVGARELMSPGSGDHGRALVAAKAAIDETSRADSRLLVGGHAAVRPISELGAARGLVARR